MRVNVYAEEITQRVEIVEKDGFTGVRFYLELPVTVRDHPDADPHQVSGPFEHHPGDDDSSAVTFWGKRDFRSVLQLAINKLDELHRAKHSKMFAKSFKIVETDNHGSDYPNEKEVPLPPFGTEALAQGVADSINSVHCNDGDRPRFWKVVPYNYVLRPGFEP